ncbi:MAG: hypothetical protein R3358_04400 [Woeseiaceae bacterium]|nr:hypothetical protein [Woeseiaceae bacterium]
MTLEQWGALGDMVGGVAVLITLIYLALQIRQTNRINASAIRQSFYDATQQQILHAIEDSEFNNVIHKAWSTDLDLEPGEATQIWRHMQGVLMGYQGAFEQYKAGDLPRADWDLARRILATFWVAEGKGKSNAYRFLKLSRAFNDDFMQELESLRETALANRRELEAKDLRV